MPIPVEGRSKAWVCDRGLAGITGSNPAGAGIFVACECCVLRGRDRLLDQRSPTECGVSECNLET
jgi:hypothetical protein